MAEWLKKSHPSHEQDTEETALMCVTHTRLGQEQLPEQGWHHDRLEGWARAKLLKEGQVQGPAPESGQSQAEPPSG